MRLSASTFAVPTIDPRGLPHRWTWDEYRRAYDAGTFAGVRTELIGGEIMDAAAQNNPQAASVTKTIFELGRHFAPPAYWMRVQATLYLDAENAPDPDFVIAPGPITTEVDAVIRPLLVIEVSDSTLLYDQIVKGSLYAAHGVEDYWIINVNDRQLEVYREPVKDASRRHGWRFRSCTMLRPPGEVAPLAKPDARINLAELFG